MGQKQNRYFSCEVHPSLPRQFLTVTPSQIEEIESNPLYEGDDRVREYAYGYFVKAAYCQSNSQGRKAKFSFKEHPQEEGDATIAMVSWLAAAETYSVPICEQEEDEIPW